MGEKDRKKYRGKRCPECGLPMTACNEITLLRAALRPFAEVDFTTIEGIANLPLEKRHFEVAKDTYAETKR